jgi:membrane protease YdiL (CAAX protease family)
MTTTILTVWGRIPTIVRSVISGLVLVSIVTLPWGALVSLNLQHAPVVPWAVPPTLLYLWLWWKYVSGSGWPRSTSAARRDTLRARPVPDEAWGLALVAGVLGIATTVLLGNVMLRVAKQPAVPIPDISQVPFLTLLCFQLTGAAVAGISEESSFRGYMQGPIERRHGPIIAITVTALTFAFAHSQNTAFSLAQVPYYLGVATTFGTMAYLTNSILPGMVLHVSAVVLDGLGKLATAEQSANAAPVAIATIWETGADASFWMSCVAVIVVGTAAVAAYIALAHSRHPAAEPANI